MTCLLAGVRHGLSIEWRQQEGQVFPALLVVVMWCLVLVGYEASSSSRKLM